MTSRVLVLAAVLSLPTLAVAQTFSGYETQITDDFGDQFDPAISEDLVVFTSNSVDLDVSYVDLTTMQLHPVTTAVGDQQLADISSGLIVFVDYQTVDAMLFDAVAGTTTNLTLLANSNSTEPSINLGLVAWTDNRDGNREIYARDLSTGEERRITNSPDVDDKSKVDGKRIVWERCVLGVCDIWTYDWATGATTQITNTTGDERLPDIDGNFVVYQGERDGQVDIFMYDLSTGVEKRLQLTGDQVDAHVSGDFVALDDLSDPNAFHIKLWHPLTGSVFPVTSGTGTSSQYLNNIDGNRIVYTDDRNGNLDIYMFTFQADFPGPLPDNCADTEGAVPLLDVNLTRSPGTPTSVDFPFDAPGLVDGLLCVDNGGAGSSLTSGRVSLNQVEVISPQEWRPTIEQHVSLSASNVLSARIAGKTGLARVRIFGGTLPENAP